MIDIQVPALGESVAEATVAQWFKQPGEAVVQDEPLVELETDKVAVEVPAPSSGVLSEIIAEVGATLEIGGLLARLDESQAGATPSAAPAPVAEPVPAPAAIGRL